MSVRICPDCLPEKICEIHRGLHAAFHKPLKLGKPIVCIEVETPEKRWALIEQLKALGIKAI